MLAFQLQDYIDAILHTTFLIPGKGTYSLFARSASWKYFEEFYHDWETLSSCSTDGLNLAVAHYTLNTEQFFNGKDRMILRVDLT